MGTRFSTPIQTGPGAHPPSYTMGTRSFPGIKLPGHGVDHPPPPKSSAEVKEKVEVRGISLLHLWAFMACYRVNFYNVLKQTWSLHVYSRGCNCSLSLSQLPAAKWSHISLTLPTLCSKFLKAFNSKNTVCSKSIHHIHEWNCLKNIITLFTTSSGNSTATSKRLKIQNL